MQFYTKLRYAKIIIFFPRRFHLQCLFPGYFSDAVYFLAARTCIILYYHYSWKCVCTRNEFWSECFLWHIAVEAQNVTAANTTVADNC
jgi:hypothetical protein